MVVEGQLRDIVQLEPCRIACVRRRLNLMRRKVGQGKMRYGDDMLARIPFRLAERIELFEK